MSSPTTTSIPLSARAAAPDLARGAMLLLIALANVHVYLIGPPGLRSYPADLGPLDKVVTLLQLLLVDGRAYPLFALLLGYGAVQLARRRDADKAVSILRRRGGWMIAIGAAHGILLFPGDIIGGYGLLTLLFAGMIVRGTDTALKATALIGIVVNGLVGLGSGLRGVSVQPSMATPDFGLALILHVVEWVGGSLTSVLSTAGMLAVGALAARHRLLDEPQRHLAFLRRTAIVGLLVAVPAGLPLALDAIGVWRPDSTVALFSGMLHQLGGLAGGVGYAALIGLLATRRAPRALLATGRRSMSSYLFQSVVFCALLPTWTLGLGADFTVWQAALLGVVTWLLSLGMCTLLDRAGQRGPAEVLLRRLTYGRPG